MKRRTAIRLAAAGATIASAGAWLVFRRSIDGDLRQVFGDDLADHPEMQKMATDFASVFASNGPSYALPDLAKMGFQSTNLAAYIETGEPLVYFGLFSPLAAPCGNPLGADFDPSPPKPDLREL